MAVLVLPLKHWVLPVSYTHLDVYKRQIHLGATTPTYDLESEPQDFKAFEHLSETDLLEATKAFIGDILQMPPAHSAIKKAVSYTHLDVYKRQALFANKSFAQDWGGDRIAGRKLASRSVVYGANGAAATAHPIASLVGIDILRKGGSAIDAAIAINAALGFLEPVSCGIGGDAFVMLWDTKQNKVVGFNGSGRSPSGMGIDLSLIHIYMCIRDRTQGG